MEAVDGPEGKRCLRVRVSTARRVASPCRTRRAGLSARAIFREIYVNKRIYRLCGSTWLRYIRLPRSVEQQAQLLERLLDPALRLPPEIVLHGVLETIPALHIAGLKQISQTAASLAVRFSEKTPVTTVWHLLSSLSAVRRVSFAHLVPVTDVLPPTPTSPINLERLCLVRPRYPLGPLYKALPHLRSLHLVGQELRTSVIPWSKLESLVLEIHPIEEAVPYYYRNFWKDPVTDTSVELESPAQLTKLVLNMPLSLTKRLKDSQKNAFDYHDFGCLLVRLPRLVDLELLQLSALGETPDFQDAGGQDLERLRLVGSVDYTDPVGFRFFFRHQVMAIDPDLACQENARRLFRLIRVFPQLETLEIDGFTWTNSTNDSEPSLPDFDSPENLHIEYSLVSGFLSFLRSTMVTRVTLRARGGRVVKLERETVQHDFVAEDWVDMMDEE
ncbi:hypothetical protein JCM10908_004827 [Rhodotorula pacifica]|uniref:uncharacterized protein n=1 Tax=Rhodotorula pacifica TaxID=1495444 RepID=UPI0031739885